MDLVDVFVCSILADLAKKDWLLASSLQDDTANRSLKLTMNNLSLQVSLAKAYVNNTKN